MKPNYYRDDWYDLEWSRWIDLNPKNSVLSDIPNDPGLYRIQHKTRKGLEYIGETSRLRGRIKALTRNIYKEKMPFRDPHTAAPCLWAIKDYTGERFEVSFCIPSRGEDKQQRKGMEAALIALYREDFGGSPTANFGRMISGYKQSSYRDKEERGCKISDVEKSGSIDSLGSLCWDYKLDTCSRGWTGLDWSDSYFLEDRKDVSVDDMGFYRIWSQENRPLLSYIGESIDIPSRLYTHEKSFGGNMLFSYCGFSGLDNSQRLEIETELIGIHYLVHEGPPIDQF